MRYTGHRLSPGNVIVYPAGMPYVARWSASKSTAVDIAPEFVQSVAGRDVATKDLEIHPAFAIKDDVVANLAALLGADALAGAPNGSLYGEGLGVRTGVASMSLFGILFPLLASVSLGRFRRDHCHLVCTPLEAAESGA